MGHLLAAPSAPEVLLDNQFFEHSQIEHDFYTIGHRVMLLNASGRSFAADPARIEDIAERRRAEQERELLLGELDHRVKNLFAVIRALAAQGTPRGWTRLRPLTTFCSSATGAALTWARLPTRCKSSQELQKPSRSSDVRQGRAPLPALGGGRRDQPIPTAGRDFGTRLIERTLGWAGQPISFRASPHRRGRPDYRRGNGVPAEGPWLYRARPGCEDQSALGALASEPPHIAVLDLNLDGERVTPVAEALQEKGVPFVLVTGYDGERLH
jgi:hypothetical protein